MSVKAPNSELLKDFESVLDDNQEYIGKTPFDELVDVYYDLDDAVSDLESENEELKKRIEELEEELEGSQ